jgi:hypothetical protein
VLLQSAQNGKGDKQIEIQLEAKEGQAGGKKGEEE